MGFKLGQAKRKMITPNNHVPVYKRNLDKGILGEAYKDGSIAVDTSVKEGSQQYKDVVAHEMDHAKRMKTGELDYGTDFVRWRGKTYPRKDGKIKYKGSWMIEGHRKLPWEKIADKAMDSPRPPKGKLADGRPASAAFQKSALKRHNDINPEHPDYEKHHYQDENGEWKPKPASMYEKEINVTKFTDFSKKNLKKMFPEMSRKAKRKIIKYNKK